MIKSGTVKALRFAGAGAVLVALGACATTTEQEAMRMEALEAKINQALQNAAAAKIDATTALNVALGVEEKGLGEKVNHALQNAASAKIDATTALNIALEAEKK